MFPVEAPRDLDLVLKHQLGLNECILSLPLKRGDVVEKRVQQAFRDYKLPFCMYARSVEYAYCVCAHALRTLDDTRWAAADKTQRMHEQAGRGEPAILGNREYKKRSGREAVLHDDQLIPADGRPHLDDEEEKKQYFEIATDTWDNTEEATNFFLAFDYILRRCPHKFRTLGTLEESYLSAVSETMEARSKAFAALRDKHGAEMERQRKVSESSDQVMALVAQHVAEIEAVDRHWNSDLENIKCKQRESYRELIMDLYEGREEGEGDMEGEEEEAKSPRTDWGPLDIAATLRVMVNRRCFCIRLVIGELTGVLDIPDMNVVEDGCGPQIPPWCTGLQSYRYKYTYDPYFPSYTKPSRTNCPGYSSPSFLYWNLSESKTTSLSAQAYGSQLNALVLCTHWVANAPDSSTVKEIHRRLKLRTDVHFQSLDEQLAQAPPLQTGGFVCTRHSNLGGSVQAIFHTLVPHTAETNVVPERVHKSLQRIIETADSSGVTSLWIPVLFMDATGVSLSALPYENARKRIEEVVKTIRSAMGNLNHNGSFEVVNLILPSMTAFMKMGPKGAGLLDRTLHFIRDTFSEI